MKIILKEGQQLFFTSDTHYSHKNICRATTEWNDAEDKTRDFRSLDHMNDTITNNINGRVGENDILFHLGDWSFGGIEKIYEFRKRIVCKNIHLILGNHDHHIEKNKQLNNLYVDPDTLKINEGNIGDHYYDEVKFGEYWDNRVYAQDLFSSVNHYLDLEVYDSNLGKFAQNRFILMHYPIASWIDMNRGIPHLHGHVHLPPQHTVGLGKSMDVGMDGHGMEAVSLRFVVNRLRSQPIENLVLPSDHHKKEIR